MKFLFLIILALATVAVIAQQKDNRIVIGTADTVNSKILNEKRVVYIHVPDGHKNQRYPVLYVLDADQHFQSAVAIVEQISGIIPNMVVVGITNTDRERDMTPNHVQPNRLVNASEAKHTGGGENFMAFIEKELIPYVDAHYPTTSYRTITGHSLGGLAVMNAFVNHQNLFNTYVAIDPSIWWQGEQWIKQAEQKLTTQHIENEALFVGIANNIPAGFDTVSIVSDTTGKAPVTHAVLPFVHWLQQKQLPGLRWGYKFYPNEWHGSVELNAEYDALRYLFGFYHFDMNNLRAHPELNADSLIAAHFDAVSAKLGYKVPPNESLVNDVAYTYWGMGKKNVAYTLFKRNTENYPQSANAFDSLGEFYEAQGDKQKAIEAYTKSLSLQETEDTQRKLNALKAK